jgi:hypothetical protein
LSFILWKFSSLLSEDECLFCLDLHVGHSFMREQHCLQKMWSSLLQNVCGSELSGSVKYCSQQISQEMSFKTATIVKSLNKR